MNSYTSRKIRVVSFLAILMVVFLHAYSLDVKQGQKVLAHEKSFDWFLQNFICFGLTRIAVPIFFLISGYLFFLNHNGSLTTYKEKITKRVKTLLVPFLFWSVAGILIYFALQNIPVSKPFFTKALVKDFTPGQFFDTLFISPIPYQLWFIRDLMVMVVFSQLLWMAMRYLKIILLCILAGLWLFDVDLRVISNEALLFFTAGGCMAIYRPQLVDLQYKRIGYPAFAFWLVLIALNLWLRAIAANEILTTIVYKLAIVLGIFAFWTVFDYFAKNEKRLQKLLKWSVYTFFIYAFHLPLLLILQKGLFYFFGTTEAAYLKVFVLAPFIAIAICFAVGIFLKSKMTRFYEIITGNR